MGANLVDSEGGQIWSNSDHWYKIALADGSELGLGHAWQSSSNNNRHLMVVVPAGQGMVFRYQRSDGASAGGYGWPQGDKGWLRGIQATESDDFIQNLSLSGGSPVRLCCYNVDGGYGFVAHQLPGNRVSLFAYDGKGTFCGLRVTPSKEIRAHTGKFPLGLDCAIVKVSTVCEGHF